MTKKKQTVTGPTLLEQVVFTENADAKKASETGHYYFGANARFLGTLNVARLIEPYRPILVINTSAVQVPVIAMGPLPSIALPAPTGAVRNGGVVTITTVEPHGCYLNQSISVAGMADVLFDGNFVITAIVSSTVFTYLQAGLNATTGGGTISLNVPINSANGVSIPRYGSIVLASGPNRQIISTAGFDVFAYMADDNILDNIS